MARILSPGQNSVLKIDSFLGLNENPDGDTTLKPGEFCEMRNFRITKDRHLQIRPGSKKILDLSRLLATLGLTPAGSGLQGVWRGLAAGREITLAAWGGHIFELDLDARSARRRGTCSGDTACFFGFGNKIYLLNGKEYLSWDGGADTAFQTVEGYIPLIQTATTPAGGGTLLEPLNRLTGKRRVRFSPDGESSVFHLPEQGITQVLSATLSTQPVTNFTSDLNQGTLTFSTPPSAGIDTLEITYRKGEGQREEVTGMRFCELFNGSADTRVFLYGDGSNRTIYSGLCHDSGQPSAEYFPQLSEIGVGEQNSPITALVRHYSRLMAYKPGSTWVIAYGTLALDSSYTTTAFTVQPVNRQLGNEAMGQARLLENDPLTLDGGGVYQWKASSSGGYANGSQNNAVRISDRVWRTLKDFDFSKVRTFNLKNSHEYWFLYTEQALIYNYANDTWYCYRDLPVEQPFEWDGELYGLSGSGNLFHLSRVYRSDDGRPIHCYAATGAMDFDRDWLVKYSPAFFVAMRPETGARVEVLVESNRRGDYLPKLVAYNLSSFSHVDFNHFSFSTNRKPQVQRTKVKVRKATFYRLIFQSHSASATATILETDVRLRYAGTVK